MDRSTPRQFSTRQVFLIVAVVAAAAVALPVGVNAATGDVVNIADGTNVSSLAKVTGGGLHVTNADATVLALASTGNAVSCNGLSGTSKMIGPVSTAAYQEIRVHANRNGGCSILVKVTVIEGGVNIGSIDQFMISPTLPYLSRTYRVPARSVRIDFSAFYPSGSGTGTGAVSVRVFGLT